MVGALLVADLSAVQTFFVGTGKHPGETRLHGVIEICRNASSASRLCAARPRDLTIQVTTKPRNIPRSKGAVPYLFKWRLESQHEPPCIRGKG